METWIWWVITISGVATFDVDSTVLVDLSLDGGGLINVGTISNTVGGDLEIIDADAVDLSGTNLSQFDDVVFGAAAGVVGVDQTTLDSVDEWGVGATLVTLTFELGDTSLNLTGVDYEVDVVTVNVTGSDGDDTVTEDDGVVLVDDRVFVYNLGEGDDRFVGEDKTIDTGAITVNGEDGDDVIVLGELAPSAVNGSNTATGGDGNDAITAADATDTLTGGDGVDTFTVAMNQLGVTITDFGAIVTTTTTGNDIFQLNIDVNTALSDTAFSEVMGNNRLPVLTVGLTTLTSMASSSGSINDIRVNDAIGTSTVALTTLANTTAAIAYIAALTNYTTVTGNSDTLADEDYVIFATTGSGSLVAFVVLQTGASKVSGTRVTSAVVATEISMITLADLGTGIGLMAQVDLILI